MGRPAQDFKIPSNVFCSMTNKIHKPLYQQLKELARAKGLSVHTLIDITLERYVKEQK